MKRRGVVSSIMAVFFTWALLGLAPLARGQCSSTAPDVVVYAAPVSGTPNLFVSCLQDAAGAQFKTTNVSTATGVFPADTSQVTGYMISSSQMALAFQNSNGHIIEPAFTSGGSWTSTDLTAVAGGTEPLSGTPLVSFDDGYGQHVVFIGSDSSVHQMINKGTWQNQTLASANSVAAGSTLGGHTFNGTEFIVYEGTNGGVDLLSFSGSSWSNTNLTALIGGEPPLTGTESGTGIGTSFGVTMGLSPQGANLIYFVGADNHVHEYSEVSGQWSDHAVLTPPYLPSTNGFFTLNMHGSTWTYHVYYMQNGAVFDAYRPYNSFSWTGYWITSCPITQCNPPGQSNPVAIPPPLSGFYDMHPITGGIRIVYLSWMQGQAESMTILGQSGGSPPQLQWGSVSVTLPSGSQVIPFSSFYW